MTRRDWITAANRFGMGASPEDAAGRSDPVGWLRGQVANPELPAVLQNAPTTIEHFETIWSGRLAAKKDPTALAGGRNKLGETINNEAEIRLLAAVTSRTSFVERWVWFWANHFSVSWRALVDKAMGALAGAYERDVIRRHAFGRFEDMLMASAKSPVMGFYLDNISSIGPNSRAGKKTNLGLNENLAREILELHTLGVDGGYSQQDVTTFAAMLTGWAFGKPGVGGKGAVFEFRPTRHEPGPKTILGRTFAASGVGQGEEALKMLAAHPSTARFVSRKLALHFISDDPSPDAVAKLEKVFRETDGDLRAVALAIIDLDAAWDNFQKKFRSPLEFLVAAYRFAGPPATPLTLVKASRHLQQAPFTAPSPAGWPDVAKAWATPDAMVRRVDLSAAIAARIPPARQRDVAEVVLDTAVTPALRHALPRVPPNLRAALVFASPEFQKR
jgi:uncharacterized protein (DUF1800 family)